MICQYCKHRFFNQLLFFKYVRCCNCAALKRNELYSFNYDKNYQKSLLQGAELKILNFQKIVSVLDINLKNKNVFDYGCGTGTIVKYLQEKNESNAHGYDPFSNEKKFRQLNVKKKPIDVLFLFDIVEHFSDLSAIEMFIKRYLKKDSVIILTTPNANSLWLKVLGPLWPHFNREHLTIASCKSLLKWSSNFNGKLLYCEPFSKFQNVIHLFNVYFKKYKPFKNKYKISFNTGELLALIKINGKLDI